MAEKRQTGDVVILGAGLHRYGIFPEESFTDFAVEAVRAALQDAGIDWQDIETGYCAYTNHEISGGHIIAQALGSSGIAITNVENASASGNSAFHEAYLSVASGLYDTAIAIGVDKLKSYRHSGAGNDKNDRLKAEPNTRAVEGFAAIARDHMAEYGTTIDQLAMVSVKNHFNGSLNPYAHYRKQVTIEEVHNARMIADPLTVLHCCPWDEGAAAVVVCSTEKARKYTAKKCPRVLASVSSGNLGGIPLADLTGLTAIKAYETAGIGAEDLGMVELHDAATIEEIIYYEALGLCPQGEGGRLVETGVTKLNGDVPVNTSGGLLAMGHPIGPTGLGQIAEVLRQMRGQAGERQISNEPKTALTQMIGVGGVCFIHLFGT
jgi:acetyl-CoA acetyltransferase